MTFRPHHQSLIDWFLLGIVLCCYVLDAYSVHLQPTQNCILRIVYSELHTQSTYVPRIVMPLPQALMPSCIPAQRVVPSCGRLGTLTFRPMPADCWLIYTTLQFRTGLYARSHLDIAPVLSRLDESLGLGPQGNLQKIGPIAPWIGFDFITWNIIFPSVPHKCTEMY